MRWGRHLVGADHLSLTADRVYLFDVGDLLTESLVVGSLVVHLDGDGAGNGEQVLRPVVMEAGNPDTIAVGDEVVVVDNQAAGWVHLTFDMPPLLRAGSEPRLGLLVGSTSDIARLSVSLGNAGVSQRFTSPYVAPPDVGGAATDVGALASVLAVGIVPWAPPANVTEEDLALLPIDVAQPTLAGAAASAVEGMACGWHYSNDSPPPPSSAIVRTDGPLAELVGSRVRVTASTAAGPASVVVIVADELPFDGVEWEDISLTSDAFMRIGALWASTVLVRVEVIA